MAPKTIKMALADMLEDLKKDEFDKFCNRLVDRREEPRVRRRRVEDKSFLDIADVLVSTFTEQGALDVALEILGDIKCSNYAKTLVEETRGLSSELGSSGTSQMECIRPRPQGRTQQDSIPTYKMDAMPCGYCLIINNVEFEKQKNRPGSNIDCDKLERRFMAFNFNVEVKKNQKKEQIEKELSTFSEKDFSHYDCCVVIILSHGTEVSHNSFPGAVYGVDGEYVTLQSITNYFNGQHCPSLRGKPKLFFIQACGGDGKDKGFQASTDEVEPSIGEADDQMDTSPLSSSSDFLSMSAEPDTRVTLPNTSDILVSYSTFPGYVSWRVPNTGSWYIETLERILEENAATVDLVTMLTMVNDEVSKKTAKGLYKQMPGSYGFLRKRLYFQTREQRQ